MMGGALQYGGRRGLANILEVLDRHGVSATFCVCGTTAESYPDAVRSAREAGHEIAGMSYAFERVRTASVERERTMVRKTAAVLKQISGAAIRGWRCPDYRVSPQTLDVLAAEGFLWDSSFLNDDVPYAFACETGPIVEIPFTTSTADKTFVGFPYPDAWWPRTVSPTFGTANSTCSTKRRNTLRA